LLDGLFGDVSEDEGLVVAVGVGLLQGFEDGSRWEIPLAGRELRIHGAQNGVGIHHDLVGRKGNERPAAHGVVGNEHRNLTGMAFEGTRDLFRSEHEATGRVEDEVDGHIRWGHADGPEDLLGVLNVDVSGKGDAPKRHGFLAMDEGDDPAFPFDFKGTNRGVAAELQNPPLENRD
jgi:hypothetical protein